jgi:hypothetical protein
MSYSDSLTHGVEEHSDIQVMRTANEKKHDPLSPHRNSAAGTRPGQAAAPIDNRAFRKPDAHTPLSGSPRSGTCQPFRVGKWLDTRTPIGPRLLTRADQQRTAPDARTPQVPSASVCHRQHGVSQTVIAWRQPVDDLTEADACLHDPLEALLTRGLECHEHFRVVRGGQ